MTNELDTTWFDDDGELTELDENDEEDELAPTPPPPPRAPSPGPEIISIPRPKATRATTQQATRKSRARRGLKNTVPQLKPPRTTNYSASSLFDWIQDDLVELNPEYQRGVVWNDTKQSALINSIVCNFYVPPIVFTVLRQDDGRELRVCIDGKQRLTSIKRFMLGEIAYKDATSNRKAYFQSPPGAKRKHISDTLKSNFKNKQITCVEYEDLTGEQEREIFQRVQLGVTLAPADRLPAINGPYADIVRAVRRRIETTHGFELYLNWGTARGKDFQALAQFIYLILYGKESNKSEPTPARLEALLSNQASDESSLKTLETTATHVMDIFCRISYHREYGEPIRKNLSPLEFVMASYLVHLHRTKLSDSQLSEAMDHMRKAFSKACPDKKSNTKNFKFTLSFVQKEVVKLYGKLKLRLPSEKCADETHFVRREAVPVGPCSTKDALGQLFEKEYYAGKSKKIARKRKREDGEDSDCSDDVYVAKTVKPKKEGSAQASLAAEAGSSSTTNLKTESAPSAGKLKRLMNPRSAKTMVKRAPRTSSSSSSAIAVDRKTSVERQVGKPTVRPLSSCRTSSVSSVVSTNQPSIAPPTAKPSTNAVASPSTSSASAPAKKPSPSIFIPKKITSRPPLPTRTWVNVTPTPTAESADPAPAFTTAIFGTQFDSSVTPVFGRVSPLGHAQAQGKLAPPEEVRNTSQVALWSPLTDPFSAICSSSTITTTSVKSPGGPGEPSSSLSNAAATKAPPANATVNANAAVQERHGASAASIQGQGQDQDQDQSSLGAVGDASTSTSTSTKTAWRAERKKYPNFTKTRCAQEIATAIGQNVAGQLGRGLNQQSISIGNNSTTAQRSASITCPANGSAHASAVQADRVRAASMGSIWTPTSTPSASPNISESTVHWWLRQGGATSAQEEPTRDPRIVLRDAAAAQTARTQQDQQQQQQQRQPEQLRESRRQRAATIKAQQNEQTQALASSAAPRTVLHTTITARRPDPNPNNQPNISPRSRANSGAAHPSKRPRTSQYLGGL